MPEINGKTIFDEDARLYDQARPDYPDELVREVMSFAALPAEGRILELGCGPGKATCQFARYGYPMLCLEPGPNLAAIAQENCRDHPGVRIEVVSFEDWRLQESAFDLVIAASSFQWLPREMRLPKTAAALRPGGTLALFWNKHPGPYSEIHQEINRCAYQQHAPELWWPDIELDAGVPRPDEHLLQPSHPARRQKGSTLPGHRRSDRPLRRHHHPQLRRAAVPRSEAVKGWRRRPASERRGYSPRFGHAPLGRRPMEAQASDHVHWAVVLSGQASTRQRATRFRTPG